MSYALRFFPKHQNPPMLPIVCKNPIFVCIGSDRSTGDALGPLVGTILKERNIPDVYGTLHDPVHAANLKEILSKLERDRFVIAVDACLGRSENVGSVRFKPGPLKPGTGVNKVLPTVGDAHVIGVVNVGGFMEYFVLQNTRLSLVMDLAKSISDWICDWYKEVHACAEKGPEDDLPLSATAAPSLEEA